MDKLPVRFCGMVTHGQKLGSEFKMPTANLDVNDSRGLEYGVYYSRVFIDGIMYKSVTNLGKKPTVKDSDSVNTETFIFDFSGDLYGTTITVELLAFRRPEQKFDSVEQLFATIREDIEAARYY